MDELQASYLKAMLTLDPKFNATEHLEPPPKLRGSLELSQASDKNRIDIESKSQAPLKHSSRSRAVISVDSDDESDRVSHISELASPDPIPQNSSPGDETKLGHENKVAPSKWLSAIRRVEMKSRASSADQHDEPADLDQAVPMSLGHTGSSVPSTAISLDSLDGSERTKKSEWAKPAPTLHRMDGGLSSISLGNLPINFGLLESLASQASEAIVSHSLNAMSIDSLNTIDRNLDHPQSSNPSSAFPAALNDDIDDGQIFKEDVTLSQLDDPQRRSSLRVQSEALLANLIGDEGDSSDEESEIPIPSGDRHRGLMGEEHYVVPKRISVDTARQRSVHGSLNATAVPFLRGNLLRAEVMNVDSDESLKSESSQTSPILDITRDAVEDDDVLMGTTQLYVSNDITADSTLSNDSPEMLAERSSRDGDLSSNYAFLEWKDGQADSELKEVGRAIEVRVNAISFDSNPKGSIHVSFSACIFRIYAP